MVPEAAHVAALNLALAVCDALQPNVIWEELRFDKLMEKNLFVGDFFEKLEKLREAAPIGFSCIVGNPPFDSELTTPARTTRQAALKDIPVPDSQIAYRIAEECVSLLADRACSCLIQPSGFLYNAKARKFAAYFVQSHKVEAVLDFVSIRNLFESADTKALALVVRREEPPVDHEIRHLTFRRTKSVHERLGFELDHYDLHFVPQSVAVICSWVWKANLLGGGRLVNLTAKITEWPTLKDYLSKKGWTHGEGFTVGNERFEATWLTGSRFLPTKALTANGILTKQIIRVQGTKFEAPRQPERFKPPMFLIGENEALPSGIWLKGELAFLHRIVSINAPKSDERELLAFASHFNRHKNELRVFCLLRSSQLLIGKSTAILKRDIEELPWPSDDGFNTLSWWEEILLSDASNFYAPLVRVGQNSAALMESVDPSLFDAYSHTFVKLLGSIYKNLCPGRRGVQDGMAYQAFTFGKSSDLDWPEDWSEHLRSILINQSAAALRTNRIIRFYQANTLIIVKSNRKRNWLASTAIRDADETLIDLQEQGF